MRVVSDSVDATRALGARIAAGAQPGECYALEGELGAGKTEFVRGFVAALDPQTVVRSPSFSIVNIYPVPLFTVYHVDFYRLSRPEELREIGFDEYAATDDGVCLIEWGTRFPEVLPPQTKVIRFRDRGNGVREIELPS